MQVVRSSLCNLCALIKSNYQGNVRWCAQLVFEKNLSCICFNCPAGQKRMANILSEDRAKSRNHVSGPAGWHTWCDILWRQGNGKYGPAVSNDHTGAGPKPAYFPELENPQFFSSYRSFQRYVARQINERNFIVRTCHLLGAGLPTR